MTASLGTLKPHLFIGTLLLPPTITFLINVKQRLFFDRNSLEPQNTPVDYETLMLAQVFTGEQYQIQVF